MNDETYFVCSKCNEEITEINIDTHFIKCQPRAQMEVLNPILKQEREEFTEDIEYLLASGKIEIKGYDANGDPIYGVT